MLWILISLFFLWCALREILGSFVPRAGFDLPMPVSKPYLALVLALAVLFAWPTVHRWHFQRFLSEKATELADNHRAKVHCNTMFDTMLDSEMLAAGHANPLTGEIGIQKPWCGTLMSYLSHPDRATDLEVESLDIFTHESMHIRGEMNEARTECEAVQRNYRAAKLLGVPDETAKRNALDYYHITYQLRGKIGGADDHFVPNDQMEAMRRSLIHAHSVKAIMFDRASGGSLHCQIGAPSLWHGALFDCLGATYP